MSAKHIGVNFCEACREARGLKAKYCDQCGQELMYSCDTCGEYLPEAYPCCPHSGAKLDYQDAVDKDKSGQ
jgi:predicted amidophosphoribosyltransferase